MDGAGEEGYKPPTEFREDSKDPLVELNLTDSTELWLIQWPVNQPPDFDGQVLSLKLRQDGRLGSFEGSSGKAYDVVSYEAQDPDVMVFLPSPAESKLVGKVSRRVSFVHYPDPNELEKIKASTPGKMHQRSTLTSLTNSSRRSATSSHRQRNSQSSSGRQPHKHSGKHRSGLSTFKEASETMTPNSR